MQMHTCPNCNGSGQVTSTGFMPSSNVTNACWVCKGQGRTLYPVTEDCCADCGHTVDWHRDTRYLTCDGYFA